VIVAPRAVLAEYDVIDVTDGGRITGVATWQDEIPTLPPLKVLADMDVCGDTAESQALKIDPKTMGLRFVLVYLDQVDKGKPPAPEYRVHMGKRARDPADRPRQFQEHVFPFVVFGLIRVVHDGLAELTSGAWYVLKERLHLRLVNYRVTTTMPGALKLLRSNPMKVQPGAGFEIVAMDHQDLLNDSAGAGFLERSPTDLSIDYAALCGSLTRPASKKAPAMEDTVSPSLTVEERLKTLKHLHDDGLITDTEYRNKKQQILDRF
jgi:hypothetical protein